MAWAADILRDYVTIETGQVHRRQTRPAPGSGPPLYCLHATAYSGRTFEPFMRALAGRRRAVALDTPGYGASDRPDAPWPFERYATAIGQAIEASGDGPVDLLGYHTGALLATELAVQKPHLVRRIVLVGVPYVPLEDRDAWRERLGHPVTLTDQLDQFEERWSFFITNRVQGVSLAQGYAHFVDELIAYPYGFWAHDALFRYAAESRLPLVSHRSLVLNPDNPLSAPSRAAAAVMPACEVLELPHLSHAVLDVAAEELARLTEAFLCPHDQA